MKTLVILLILFVTLSLRAQTNREIATVYFKKAERSMEKIDYQAAKIDFDKGVKVLDSISRKGTAQQGAFIYYELKAYEEAIGFAKTYFKLSHSKSSEEYTQMLELYVDMQEDKEKALKAAEAKKKAKEKELKKIDSLKKSWHVLEEKFTLKIDSLYSFNKKGIALFKKGAYYGIIDDKGEVVVEANAFKEAKQHECFFILTDSYENAAKIYCYNSITKKKIALTKPFKYNDNLSSYGRITLPRANDMLVMYPTEIGETLVYDLEEERFSEIDDENLKSFFKQLKKEKK